MKSFLLAAAAATALSASAMAFAQVAPPPGVSQGTSPMVMAPVRPVPPVAPMAPGTRFMVMSDKVMTRAEVADHVRRFFERLDTNHDGFITRDEMKGMHERMMGMRGEMEKKLGEHGMMMGGGDRSAAFNRLDTNHDGMISRQEFMAAKPVREERVFVLRSNANGPAGADMPSMEHMMRMHGMGAGMGEGMGLGAHLFDIADANHDGRVSLQEAEAAALAHFDRADINHDGKLTPDERGKMHQMIRIERHPA